MYKCIIVDDEPHAIEGLLKHIESMSELEVIATYTDPVKALIEISAGQHLDLVLLDVDMPGITGIELANEIRKKTDKLVFTTAHSKYAYEAFQIEANAFLLKPYSLTKFISTISKLFPKKNKAPGDTHDIDNFVLVKSKEENLKLIKVNIRDIIAVESKVNYIQIHVLNKSITTYMTLSEIAKILNEQNGFVQFQRSFIIAKEHIESISGNSVKMSNGVVITVGEYYRKSFNELIDAKLLKTRRKSS
ncbi:LytR/AlgR family response regulator transcription factor [Pedobacter jeongneungensis]|uniref:LytR/AlgR family response regulator transcription factor n=1 Tax=Pedobacter jeongneungensis TaxID=947309 RepID=UPI000468D103|nr:LytTR family DNA-binding domain-containing protein [Pedobacter jeongneungensis]